jgi:light-regulated signal transduction histidine kinase (bacteriophytochrome)
MALDGEERLLRHATDYRGAEVFAATRHLDRTGWGMVVKIDRAEALAAVSQFRDMLLVGSILVTAAVLALAMWVSRRIADPVVELTAELERRSTELEAANVALEQQMSKLEQFAYATSHDLQEPLRSITGFVQLLERHFGEDLDERSRQYMDFVVSGAERLRHLIEDLLEYSRAERVELAPELVDLNREVREVLESLNAATTEAGAQIEVASLPSLSADPRLLRPLLQNLLTNALKFRRPGGARHRVVVSARSVDGGWEMSVVDNGIGIDPDSRERVFGIFQRLHTREEYPGTGIGLAICQTAVEQHGGSIRVEEGIDGGTAFVVFLPG